MSRCEYCGVDGYYGVKLVETQHWIIYLAPSQRYLGTCVVALKRKCRDLSELNDSEWIDFSLNVRMLEETLKELFSPELFNWSCFKNSEFRSEDPDPEIHWHFSPRYSRPVYFEGERFDDPDFGYIPKPIQRRVKPGIMGRLEALIKGGLLNHQKAYGRE